MAKGEVDKAGRLIRIAREEGFIPGLIVHTGRRAEESLPQWDDPEVYAECVQRGYRRNKWNNQPTYIAVWSEKSTVEGTIRPVLKELRTRSSPSTDSVRQRRYGTRSRRAGRDQPTLLLYIGDWDPSGLCMSELDLPKRMRGTPPTDRPTMRCPTG